MCIRDRLTTCVRDVATGENIYPEGEEEWNGVVIRRFRTNPVQREKERYFAKKAKPARKLRQFLFKLGILKYLSYSVSYTHLRRQKLLIGSEQR